MHYLQCLQQWCHVQKRKKNIYKYLYKKKKEKSALKNNLKRERFPVMNKKKKISLLIRLSVVGRSNEVKLWETHQGHICSRFHFHTKRLLLLLLQTLKDPQTLSCKNVSHKQQGHDNTFSSTAHLTDKRVLYYQDKKAGGHPTWTWYRGGDYKATSE